MRLKLAILILITLAVLTACQSQSMSTPMLPVIKPSITGLNTVEIDQPTADSIRQHMRLFLKSTPYTEYETGNQLLIYLVSSGKFDQTEIILATGEIYQASVLYTYALMSSQRVVVAPVLVGLLLPDGRYVYFSEKYSSESNSGVTTTSADQQTAMADTQARLPRGRIFRLLAYGMVSRQGLDWQKCMSVSILPI